MAGIRGGSPDPLHGYAPGQQAQNIEDLQRIRADNPELFPVGGGYGNGGVFLDDVLLDPSQVSDRRNPFIGMDTPDPYQTWAKQPRVSRTVPSVGEFYQSLLKNWGMAFGAFNLDLPDTHEMDRIHAYQQQGGPSDLSPSQLSSMWSMRPAQGDRTDAPYDTPLDQVYQALMAQALSSTNSAPPDQYEMNPQRATPVVTPDMLAYRAPQTSNDERPYADPPPPPALPEHQEAYNAGAAAVQQAATPAFVAPPPQQMRGNLPYGLMGY